MRQVLIAFIQTIGIRSAWLHKFHNEENHSLLSFPSRLSINIHIWERDPGAIEMWEEMFVERVISSKNEKVLHFSHRTSSRRTTRKVDIHVYYLHICEEQSINRHLLVFRLSPDEPFPRQPAPVSAFVPVRTYISQSESRSSPQNVSSFLATCR